MSLLDFVGFSTDVCGFRWFFHRVLWMLDGCLWISSVVLLILVDFSCFFLCFFFCLIFVDFVGSSVDLVEVLLISFVFLCFFFRCLWISFVFLLFVFRVCWISLVFLRMCLDFVCFSIEFCWFCIDFGGFHMFFYGCWLISVVFLCFLWILLYIVDSSVDLVECWWISFVFSVVFLWIIVDFACFSIVFF